MALTLSQVNHRLKVAGVVLGISKAELLRRAGSAEYVEARKVRAYLGVSRCVWLDEDALSVFVQTIEHNKERGMYASPQR